MKNFKLIKYILCCLALCFCFLSIDAQRRRRPDSMKHTEKEAQDYMKKTPVQCTYISNGHSFSGNVYVVGDGARIKIGTSTITFKAGKYILSFVSESFKSRDTNSYIWTYEKMLNDFNQSGAYETFFQGQKYYLRMYDGLQYSDIPLSNRNATSFVLAEDELCFEYKLD